MILFKNADTLRNYLEEQAKNGKKAGFVPTMGALHKGHLLLAETCKKENDISIVSIFVNPTQFNDPGDFKNYPVTLEKDIMAIEQAGCEVLFLPSVEEIYPNGMEQKKIYPLGYLEEILEGKFRPGHFQGVCMVVDRLLEIVGPDRLYLGQKDYQQCMVIKKLIELLGKRNEVHAVICPTLREPDGLAMSSRNLRLNPTERKIAPAIYNALQYIRSNIPVEKPAALKTAMTESLIKKGFRVDYVEIADAATLEPVNEWDGKQQLVTLAAAFLNEVRLIDNLVLNI